MTGILKTSHFSSEKRCKDKQKNSRLQVFSGIKKQGYKEGYKRYKSINKGYKRGISGDILIPR